MTDWKTRASRFAGALAPTLAVSCLLSSAAAAEPRCTSAAPRRFDDVLALVAASDRSRAVEGDIAAAEALERQAATRLNPELSLELEDFTGSGTYSAFGETQTTLSLSQRLELGRRRELRAELAGREAGVERARGRQEGLALAVRARQDYVALIASRERRRVRSEAEGLSRQALAEARRRRERAAGSSADEARAAVAATTSALELAEADREVDSAARRLARLWGGGPEEAACLGEESLAGLRFDEPRSGARAAAAASSSPTVALAEAEVDARRAEVAKARGDATPDLEVGAGLRHLASPNEVSVVAGLAVELPLFDRNRGNIDAAEHRLFAAQARAAVARRDAEARIERLRAEADAAGARAAALGSRSIPAAERAVGELQRAWSEGAATSTELLGARQLLVTLRLERIDALAEEQRTLAALDGARGSLALPGAAREDDSAETSADEVSR